MSQMTQLSTDSTTGPSVGLSTLERAWEMQWALRLACGVLFVDIALLLWAKQGLMAWSAHSEGLMHDLAFLAVALATFALLMSLILPLLGAVVRWLGWELIALLPSRWFSHTEHRGRPLGYVAEHDLLELALRENNDFLLSWYRHHVSRREESEAFLHTLGNLVFGCLVLAIVNGVLPLTTAVGDSLMASAMNALHDYALPIALVLMVSSGALLKHAWFPAYALHWIYYPPLDLEQREKVRKARDRH